MLCIKRSLLDIINTFSLNYNQNIKHSWWGIIFRNDRLVHCFKLCQNYTMSRWFCDSSSSFEAVSCFICGQKRVAVIRHRMSCLFILSEWKMVVSFKLNEPQFTGSHIIFGVKKRVTIYHIEKIQLESLKTLGALLVCSCSLITYKHSSHRSISEW